MSDNLSSLNLHLCDQDVDQQDDGQTLVHRPHGITHKVGEFKGEDGAFISLVFCFVLDPCVLFCVSIKDSPEDVAEHPSHPLVLDDALISYAVQGVLRAGSVYHTSSCYSKRLVHEPKAKNKGEVDDDEDSKDVDDVPDYSDEADDHWADIFVKEEPPKNPENVH